MTNTVNKMIGIDIGGTSIKFSLMDKNGTIEKRWSIPTNISEKGKFIPHEICESIRSQVLSTNTYVIEGIGIGFLDQSLLMGKSFFRRLILIGRIYL